MKYINRLVLSFILAPGLALGVMAYFLSSKFLGEERAYHIFLSGIMKTIYTSPNLFMPFMLKAAKLAKKSLTRRHLESRKVELGRDDLFYHDMMNHLHSMKLYIESREEMGLDAQETRTLKSELLLSAGLLAAHFKREHKNFERDHSNCSLEDLKAQFHHLKNVYLNRPDLAVQVEFINFSGPYYLPKEKVLRIFTNLIKNVSESARTKVEVKGERLKDRLRVCFKNNVFSLEHRDGVEGQLSRLIEDLDEIRSRRQQLKIGMSSIEHLVEKVGGTIDYGLYGENWVTEMEIPLGTDQLVKGDLKAS